MVLAISICKVTLHIGALDVIIGQLMQQIRPAHF